MNVMTVKKLYLILQSVLCVLLVFLLSSSAVSIYREGNALREEDPMISIYTPEKTAAKFKPIAPLFFGAIGMTVAGWALAVNDKSTDKPAEDAEYTRDLTTARVAFPSEAMKIERARQKKLFRGGWGLFALCMIPIAVYMLNGAHFAGDDLEEMISQLSLHVVPWIIVGLGCLILTSVLQEKSMQRETAAAREQIEKEKAAGVMGEAKPGARVKKHKAKRILRAIVAVAAVVFIILGVMNGSAKAVHTKAANICTECVGLG
jgi:hypothetical protein